MIPFFSLIKLARTQWWILVSLSIFFLIVGRTSAVLLGRFYYAEGGSSMCMATVVQTAGFPILCIPLIIIPSTAKSSDPPNRNYILIVYIALGVLLAGINLLHAVGLLYLSASTYSLVCSTQLAFHALFALVLNKHKMSLIILNSIIILSFSAALVAANQEGGGAHVGVSNLEYAIGVICTLCASAVYSLWLSLVQLAFQRVLKTQTFVVVMEMQLYTSLVATVVSVAGLFATGQWKYLGGEMRDFNTGPASYLMTLVWTAISWQVCSVSVVGLIFLVSALFSNAIVIVALAVAPIASLVVFHDRLGAVKGIAILQALWGFSTFLYQNYLDDQEMKSEAMQLQVQMQMQMAGKAQMQKLRYEHTNVGENSKGSRCVLYIDEADQ